MLEPDDQATAGTYDETTDCAPAARSLFAIALSDQGATVGRIVGWRRLTAARELEASLRRNPRGDSAASSGIAHDSHIWRRC